MTKSLREKLINAAIENHVGLADGCTFWHILEKPWFSGERYFEIWNDKSQEYSLTVSKIGKPILIKEIE